MAAPNGRSRRRGGRGARRFFFLAVVGLVTLSLTFFLGVLVGQKWGRRPLLQAASEPAKKPPAPTRRALSEAETVKPPQIQEKLTFYQTLTAPLGATPPPAKAEAPKSRAPKPEAKAADDPAKERTRAEGTGTWPPTEAPPPEPSYTVQVSASRLRPAAEEMEKRLKGAGFEASVAPVTGDDGRTTYRVRVGSFATRGEAEQLAERLRSDRGLSTFVTTR